MGDFKYNRNLEWRGDLIYDWKFRDEMMEEKLGWRKGRWMMNLRHGFQDGRGFRFGEIFKNRYWI